MADDEHVERVLRHSVKDEMGRSFESTLLNLAISDPEFLDTLDSLPRPEEFENAWNAQFWDAILETRRTGIFTITRFQTVLKQNGFTPAECQRSLNFASDALLSRIEATAAIDYLRNRTLAKRASVCAQDFLSAVGDEHWHKAPEALERLEIQLADVSRGIAHGGWEFGEDVSSDRAPCVATGLRDLDDMMGGLQMGVLGVIGARPSIGKTAVACSLALNIARRGEGVGIFSLEMPSYDLQCRLAAAHAYQRSPRVEGGNSGNPYYQPFFHKRMHGPHLERMTAALREVRRLPIAFDGRKGLSASDIRSATRRLKNEMERRGTPLRAVFVDHIGHIRPETNRGGNRTSEMTDTSKALMDMAADLDIAVVGLSQLSRAVEQRANKRPMLSDLRESGSIEQDAAYVMFLYRDEYYADRAHDDEDAPKARQPANRNVMEFIIAKQRNGPVGTVEAFCEVGANAILDSVSEFARRAA